MKRGKCSGRTGKQTKEAHLFFFLSFLLFFFSSFLLFFFFFLLFSPSFLFLLLSFASFASQLSAGKFFNDAEKDKGVQTSTDARFYDISAKFEKGFSNAGKDLVIQFRVKHEQNIDCGGGYVKVFPSSLDQENMHGDSPYAIMFGPDICGPGTRKVHVIFTYKGKNLLTKHTISCKTDELSHLYTLIVRSDNTYEVRIDGEKEYSGSMYDDFDFLLPRKINDPSVSKPADWVDEKEIVDPEDKKPEDWVEEEMIVDPEASQPEDWDEEMDGEWEAPMIKNPDFKGEWKAKMIANPEYKGEWEHPQIDNPEFVDDKEVYKFDDLGAIGIDIWQVKSGSIFDDILVTDDVSAAEAAAEEFKALAKGEQDAKKKADDAAEAERKAKEAAEKAAEEDEDGASTTT